MSELEKLCRFLSEYLMCNECPYQKLCTSKKSYLGCAEFLKSRIYRTAIIEVYRDFYTELDKILEIRGEKESLERQSGILLARLELLDYIRKKTANE